MESRLESAGQIRDLWSRTYNTQGKPDWSHIYPYYDESIVFRDSIQEVRGIAEFTALCERLTLRCKELRMDILSLEMREGTVFIQWDMTMMFRKFPSSTLHGCTVLALNGAGKIVRQRDYYDLWGDIFDNIPWFARPYRKFMRRKFG